MKPAVHSPQSTVHGPQPSSSFCPRSTAHSPQPSSAFTLIELLVVMVVVVVIMAVSLPAFIGIGRGAGMRTAVNNVRSTLSLSRQWAITHREEITFVASSTGMTYNMTNGVFSLAGNDHACYYAIAVSPGATSLIQSITDLPLDVTFSDDSDSETNLTFKTDGGLAEGPTTFFIKLVDKRAPSDTDKQRTISVNGLTGGIRVQN